MRLIWATRGRSWGFRFLLDGGFPDPLPEYERGFRGADGEAELCRRFGDNVALRFPDPAGRRDEAGRIIQHEFVVSQPLADKVHTVEDGREIVWALVADAFLRLWNGPEPPTRADVNEAMR